MKSEMIKTVSMRLVPISSVVALAILLAAAPASASSEPVVRNTRCSEFQFMASVPFTDAKGKPQTTTAYLWIPEKCRTIRGIVLAQQNVAEQGFAENAAIRQACRDTDMAMVWFNPFFAPTFEHPDQDGAVLQKALDELATVSGYAEIASAPWLPFGHSTIGFFTQRLANWKPERCLAQIVFKCMMDFTLPNNRQVPLFELGSNFTEWGQQKKDWTKNAPNFWEPTAIGKDRATTHRPMSFLLENGSSHFVMTDAEADMIAMYVRKVVPARLPAAGGVLKPVDIDSGWVVDLDMSNPRRSPAQPAKSATDSAKNGVWFFDKEMAMAVETLMNVNWTRKTQIPVILRNDGAIPAVQDSGLFEGVAPVVGEDGVTFTLKPAFLDRIPTNFTTGAGQALGHSDKGKIQIAWLSGNAMVTGTGTIRPIVDRLWGSMIYVRHPGDDEYRPSIQPFNLGFPSNKTGKPQTLTFPEIPDQAAGTTPLELKAVTDAGLPVEYCVIVGPARVSGKTLTFTDIPPRSRFPIKVTIRAIQFGRSIEPAVQSTRMVERSFMITPRVATVIAEALPKE
ncbi:MAG: hypothetical protein WCS52_17440 [bacterium]